MDGWGELMLQSVSAAAEMTAIGLDLPANTFTQLARFGPHLLAPTGSDLQKHDKIGTVFAGYHYDLNLLTIHGKSRFPGLYIWRRDGKKLPVSVPPGCLLVQAGKQLEWLTSGKITAGYHEVVCTEQTVNVRQKSLVALLGGFLFPDTRCRCACMRIRLPRKPAKRDDLCGEFRRQCSCMSPQIRPCVRW